MNQDFSTQQLKWLEAYCDGTISPEEFAQFETALKSDADFRALTRTYLTMDANLSQGAESTLELSDSWHPPQPVKPLAKATYLWAFAALGLVLFFAGLSLGGVLKSSTLEVGQESLNQHGGVAILKRVAGASWAGDSQPIENEALLPGRYQLAEGSAEIEFYSGTRLLLEAPVDLDLISSNEAFCHSGKLRALVPPQARGFTVQSSKFELVDLGTEFGLSVSEDGSSNVQVFDGEVELYPPDTNRDSMQLKKLGEGTGISYSQTGETAEITTTEGEFLSFQDHQAKTRAAVEKRYDSWQQWNQSVRTDTRVLAHFDFQDNDSLLRDKGKGGNHGAIIGAEWTGGRFPGKRALEFRRPGDRVRLDIPGDFKALTYSAWVRMDTDTGRTQALFLTDNYKIGYPHWQVSPTGTLRFGFRMPPSKGGGDEINGAGFGSPQIFTPRRVGIWTFVATTFSLETNRVVHYLNGVPLATDFEYVEGIPVSAEPVNQRSGSFEGELPEFLNIGVAEIGNWGAPHRPDVAQIAVRNFVGRIDAMTIWRAALDDSEIADLYDQTRL